MENPEKRGAAVSECRYGNWVAACDDLDFMLNEVREFTDIAWHLIEGQSNIEWRLVLRCLWRAMDVIDEFDVETFAKRCVPESDGGRVE